MVPLNIYICKKNYQKAVWIKKLIIIKKNYNYKLINHFVSRYFVDNKRYVILNLFLADIIAQVDSP